MTTTAIVIMDYATGYTEKKTFGKSVARSYKILNSIILFNNVLDSDKEMFCNYPVLGQCYLE